MPFGAEVTFVGQLISAPKLDYAQNGQATCKFTFLVSRTWKDRNSGKDRETRITLPVVTWGSLAENVAKSLEKGDRVLVMGREEEKTWDDEHRERHTRIELTANDVGPCASWATFEVTRNPRPERDAPPAEAAPSRPRDTVDIHTASRPADDEEPF